MKKQALILLFLVATTLQSILSAQTGFKWQGLAKDAAGIPVTQPVTLTFTILQNNTAVYAENHASITPVDGQLTATVGMGTPIQGTFSGIDWSAGACFLNVKMKIGSGAVLDMGTSEILSVPKASYAEKAGSSGDWAKNGNNIYRLDGNVGIGTSTPAAPLEITTGGGITIHSSFADPDEILFKPGTGTSTNDPVDIVSEGEGAPIIFHTRYNNDTEERMRIAANGRIGIGTIPGGTKFHVLQSSNTEYSAVFDNNGGAGKGTLIRCGFNGNTDAQQLWVGDYSGQNVSLFVRGDGRVGIGTISPSALLDVNGHAKVQVLEITGGSDLAENFDITSPQPEPGLLVSIDTDHPGQLKISSEAYDRKVAGIISGAGGIAPGMVMGQEESIANGKYPVAMVGRVYVHADASFGKITPGDMLTTSPTAGVAMKVNDFSLAHGAIIGKAMTSLTEGQGLVMVLVNLQ